ncbi:hypothetical protein R3P38DRAFT_3221649 [Favolaschia claudopus]|uniref:Uncharacterized protein n=1 Tax=Favolaschia claudopus TaxID=2862362 RepID=A0AAV9ZZG4_9AGAR
MPLAPPLDESGLNAVRVSPSIPPPSHLLLHGQNSSSECAHTASLATSGQSDSAIALLACSKASENNQIPSLPFPNSFLHPIPPPEPESHRITHTRGPWHHTSSLRGDFDPDPRNAYVSLQLAWLPYTLPAGHPAPKYRTSCYAKPPCSSPSFSPTAWPSLPIRPTPHLPFTPPLKLVLQASRIIARLIPQLIKDKEKASKPQSVHKLQVEDLLTRQTSAALAGLHLNGEAAIYVLSVYLQVRLGRQLHSLPLTLAIREIVLSDQRLSTEFFFSKSHFFLSKCLLFTGEKLDKATKEFNPYSVAASLFAALIYGSVTPLAKTCMVRRAAGSHIAFWTLQPNISTRSESCVLTAIDNAMLVLMLNSALHLDRVPTTTVPGLLVNDPRTQSLLAAEPRQEDREILYNHKDGAANYTLSHLTLPATSSSISTPFVPAQALLIVYDYNDNPQFSHLISLPASWEPPIVNQSGLCGCPLHRLPMSATANPTTFAPAGRNRDEFQDSLSDLVQIVISGQAPLHEANQLYANEAETASRDKDAAEHENAKQGNSPTIDPDLEDSNLEMPPPPDGHDVQEEEQREEQADTPLANALSGGKCKAPTYNSGNENEQDKKAIGPSRASNPSKEERELQVSLKDSPHLFINLTIHYKYADDAVHAVQVPYHVLRLDAGGQVISTETKVYAHLRTCISNRKIALLPSRPPRGERSSVICALDGSQQLKFAAAQIESTVQKGKAAFAKELEFFAGAQIDWFDVPGYYSNMLCDHNVPDGYNFEMFFFLQQERSDWRHVKPILTS